MAGLTVLVLAPLGGAAYGTPKQGQQVVPQVAAGDVFAVVTAGGSLVRGTLGTSVSHVADSGRYDVHFARSMAGCVANANLGYPSDHEDFTFQSVVTVGRTANPNTVSVDVTDPGPANGGPPSHPVLRDNAFHLHAQCGPSGQHAVVGATGSVISGSSGVSAVRTSHGHYKVSFASDISSCAPVVTVRAGADRVARAIQAFLAQGVTGHTVSVSINLSDGTPISLPFELTVTCSGAFALFPSSSGFFNPMTLTAASACGYTGSWYAQSPGTLPSAGGYLSTWYSTATTAGVQTKNGGYGVSFGTGVDLVATC